MCINIYIAPAYMAHKNPVEIKVSVKLHSGCVIESSYLRTFQVVIFSGCHALLVSGIHYLVLSGNTS